MLVNPKKWGILAVSGMDKPQDNPVVRETYDENLNAFILDRAAPSPHLL